MFFVRQNCWVKMMLCAREPSSNASPSQWEMSMSWHVTSSYVLLPSIFTGSDSIDLRRGDHVGASRRQSVCCESGRWREESAADRIHRKRELGEGVGWLLRWRAWRLSGWADVALQTTVLTSWRLLSNILFSIFLFFLLVRSFSKYLQKQFQLRNIPTKIMLRMVS